VLKEEEPDLVLLVALGGLLQMELVLLNILEEMVVILQ
jgi:hypothetical protein